jgi:hypothetical protein
MLAPSGLGSNKGFETALNTAVRRATAANKENPSSALTSKVIHLPRPEARRILEFFGYGRYCTFLQNFGREIPDQPIRKKNDNRNSGSGSPVRCGSGASLIRACRAWYSQAEPPILWSRWTLRQKTPS